jgi:hypothetical protein
MRHGVHAGVAFAAFRRPYPYGVPSEQRCGRHIVEPCKREQARERRQRRTILLAHEHRVICAQPGRLHAPSDQPPGVQTQAKLDEQLFVLLNARYLADRPTVLMGNERPDALPARLHSRIAELAQILWMPVSDNRRTGWNEE